MGEGAQEIRAHLFSGYISPNTRLHLVKKKERNRESGLSKSEASKRIGSDSFSTSHITPAGKPDSTWPVRKGDHE